MIRRSLRVALTVLVIIAGTSAACWPWRPQPDGELSYAGPVEQSIAAGETLPGTEIAYIGLHDEGAALVIRGQQAVKKKGDSLDWDGHPVPEVELTLRQRVIWYNEDTIHAAGTARLTVEDTQPVPASFPEDLPMVYKLPTTYNVKVGETIPGTTLSYAGSNEDGAEIGGIEGYSYRKVADSMVWEGTLREHVFLRVNLRVVFYNENQLQVAGLATIGLVP